MRNSRPLFLAEMIGWPVPVAKGTGWSVSCRPAGLKVVVLLRPLREHPVVPPARAPIAAAVTETQPLKHSTVYLLNLYVSDRFRI